MERELSNGVLHFNWAIIIKKEDISKGSRESSPSYKFGYVPSYDYYAHARHGISELDIVSNIFIAKRLPTNSSVNSEVIWVSSRSLRLKDTQGWIK